MAGLRVRGSGRAGLVVVALLIGALATVSGDAILANLSPFFVQIYDVTTPIASAPLAPNTSYLVPWGEDYTGNVPDARKFHLLYYPFGNPIFNNDTQASGTKVILASTYIYNNATIEFWEPAGSQYIAVAVKYS